MTRLFCTSGPASLKQGFGYQVNYHLETGWFEDSRIQGVEGSSGRSEEGFVKIKLKSSPEGKGFYPIPRMGQYLPRIVEGFSKGMRGDTFAG